MIKAMATKDSEGVGAANRALEVLTCFKVGDNALSLAEMAERTGLIKSTILRLLPSLIQYNLVVRMHDGGYQLGAEIARLNTIHQESNELERYVQPVLAQLAAETGETATFYVRQGDVRVCLFRVNSPSNLRLDVSPGARRPMDHAGSAQLLRLFAQWPDQKPEIPRLPIYTAGATTPHVASMSVPVIGQGDRLVGSLSLAGPEARLSEERAQEFALQLLTAGLNLSRALGGAADAIYRISIAYANQALDS